MRNILMIALLVFLASCSAKNPCRNGHTWNEATCTAAKSCTICGLNEGEPIDHNWNEAKCTTPKICSVCKLEEGDALGHSFGEPIITKYATCSEVGTKTFTCQICNTNKDEAIPTIAHTPGEWQIVTPATATTKGKKAQKCSVCGGTILEEEFEKSAAEIKADYKANCANYTYKEISRNPDNYKGKYAHFKGEIIQSIESGNSYTFRVDITKTSYGWTDTIMVTYTKKEAGESRLLEDDVIDLYGMLGGTYTYETVMGNEMTIPILYAEYVELR